MSILGLLTFREWSRDHDVKGEFVSAAKPIIFAITGKRILCWSIVVIEPISDFGMFLGYWPLKNGSYDHDVKGEFVSLTRPIVFSTASKNGFMALHFFYGS